MEILDCENMMNSRKLKDILKAAHFSIQIWNKEKAKKTESRYAFLKNYSIGDFMDFRPLQYHAKHDQISPD